MTDTSPTPLPDDQTPTRYPSLLALRAGHGELVQRRRATGDTPALLAEVRAFIGRGEATGALLDAEEDRLAAQSLLDFWANVLVRAGEQPPDATLADFDPLLAPELPDAPCPYRGLAAFGEADRDFFFGRERLLDKMIGRLRDGERLLAVVGSSGSGKSSLVLAGLLPRLRAGALPGSEGWRYATIVPGSQPLTNLAHALQPTGEAAAGLDVTIAAKLLFAADGFRRDPDYLVSALNATSAAPLVLVVDQFEELFTLCADGEARDAFVRQLLGLAVAACPHRVILTMRTDFVDNVAGLPELYPLFRAGRVDVEALDINELAAAIEGPAARVGLKFEAGIVDDLVTTILGERAGLPLLQFTLLKLWEKRQRNRVTAQVYREVGNPREALERSAEAFYRSLIPEEQETAKRILLRMVRPGEGREVTSNRIRRAELFRDGEAADRVERVLDRLINEARLVKVTAGETPTDAQVEVAHEALVRNWPRLVDWLDDERETLRKRRRLTDAAEQWERTGRDAGALLRGALLDEALRYDDLNELENAFVQASQDELAAAEREREAARQRELEHARALAEEQRRRADEQTRAARQMRRLLIALAAVFTVALVATLVAAGLALARQQQASNAQATALAQQQRLLNAQATAQAAALQAVSAAATKEAAVAKATAANATAQAEATARVAADNSYEGSLAKQEASLAYALTVQARLTALSTPEPLPSMTPTPTGTPTSRTVSSSPTATGLRTPAPTSTATSSPTPSGPPLPPLRFTETPTSTLTATASRTPSTTPTYTPTATPMLDWAATTTALVQQLDEVRATQTAIAEVKATQTAVAIATEVRATQTASSENMLLDQVIDVFNQDKDPKRTQCVQLADKALQVVKNDWIRWQLFKLRGMAYYFGYSDKDRALADFDEATRLYQSDAYLYVLRGLIFYDRGRRQDAVADFSRAIELDSNDWITFYMRGLIYFQIGDPTGDLQLLTNAERDFRKAADLHPVTLTFYHVGLVCYETKKYKDAIIGFQGAIEDRKEESPVEKKRSKELQADACKQLSRSDLSSDLKVYEICTNLK